MALHFLQILRLPLQAVFEILQTWAAKSGVFHWGRVSPFICETHYKCIVYAIPAITLKCVFRTLQTFTSFLIQQEVEQKDSDSASAFILNSLLRYGVTSKMRAKLSVVVYSHFICAHSNDNV